MPNLNILVNIFLSLLTLLDEALCLILSFSMIYILVKVALAFLNLLKIILVALMKIIGVMVLVFLILTPDSEKKKFDDEFSIMRELIFTLTGYDALKVT